MRLRPKILLMLTGVLAVSLVASVGIQQFVVYPQFVRLERGEALKDWERARGAIDREIEHLSLLCLDWSSWTDTYKFAKGEFPGYYDANIGKLDWFADQALDVFYVCAPDGRVVWGQVLDLDSLEPTEISWMPTDRLPADHPLLRVDDSKESHVQGLVMTERGLMMFAARPILTSQNEGPRAGVLVFGRLLSADSIESLREKTHVDFGIHTVDDSELADSEHAAVRAALGAMAPQVEEASLDELAVRGPLVDLAGAPVAVIQARVARHITAQGRTALWFASASLFCAGGMTLVMLIVGLRRMVVTPLISLTEHVREIAASGNLHRRLDMVRGDELGVLAGQFNEMLERLEEYRSQSVMMSRQAGMAETATGVLHNVGNALTNANVLAETVTDSLSRSKASNLSKAAKLLTDHRDDLSVFLSQDQRGKQLPAFLGQLAEHLTQEVSQNARDMESLRAGLQHIKEIVASQQDMARCSAVTERVDLRDLVAKSAQTVQGSMERHGIELRVAVAEGTTVVCDRSKLHQVISNLLMNAKDAICASKGAARHIEVHAGMRSDAHMFLEVRDHGVGIRPEHRARVFANGFTTKPEGHGFGLHYCALAIKEMGGTLTASSDGPGLGARFRIELPATAPVAQEGSR